MRLTAFDAYLDPRRNAFALLRVILAVAVIYHHTFPIAGFDNGFDPLDRFTDFGLAIGPIAVCGFFAISGFLITQSWLRSDRAATYVWHRVLRIMPGYWAALIFTALIAAPLAYLLERGGLFGMPWRSAFGFIAHNSLLSQRQLTIPGVLTEVPYRSDGSGVLNGSLWTLLYEVICYALIAVMGITRLLKAGRRRWPILVVFVSVAAWSAWASRTGWELEIGGVGLRVDHEVLKFLVAFMAGAVIAAFADRVPGSDVLGVVALAITAFNVARGTLGVVAIVALSYTVLWAAARLPIHRADRFGDLSYGLYVLASPIQQLLATTSLSAAGPLAFFVVSTALTAVAAYGSWHLIERPLMRYKHLFARRGESDPAAPESAAPDPSPAEVAASEVAVPADR